MNLHKTGVILFVLLLTAMAMIPIASAANVQSIASASSTEKIVSSDNQDTKVNASATMDLLPYATINAYGPGSAGIGQQVSIYTSGEIGNFLGPYWQKFYMQNLNTGTQAGIQYISVPSDWWKTGDMYSKTGFVTLHDTFSSAWTVQFNQAGTYEVVASVMGPGSYPQAQSRITVSVS
ncbi:MAG: hypothetical protein WC626_07280 [Methanoregula sp.]